MYANFRRRPDAQSTSALHEALWQVLSLPLASFPWGPGRAGANGLQIPDEVINPGEGQDSPLIPPNNRGAVRTELVGVGNHRGVGTEGNRVVRVLLADEEEGGLDSFDD